MQKQVLKFTNEMLMLKFTLNIELVIKRKMPLNNQILQNFNYLIHILDA